MSRRLESGEQRFDVAGAVDGLRYCIARAGALVHATEDLFDRYTWVGPNNEDADKRDREHLAHLLGATGEALRAAQDAGDKIAAALLKHKAVG